MSALGPGGCDIFSTGNVSTTTATVPSIPNSGKTIYVRLGTFIGGVWQWANYTYTAAPAPPPLPTVKAALLTPALNASITPTMQFTWDTGSGVSLYMITVSVKGPGGTDVYSSGGIKGTTATVNIPVGATKLYVRVWSFINGVWQWNDYVIL